jgi:hypothetical protein
MVFYNINQIYIILDNRKTVGNNPANNNTTEDKSTDSSKHKKCPKPEII